MKRGTVIASEALALVSSLTGLSSPVTYADTPGCTLVAKNEVWLRIFEESDHETPGAQLMELHLQKDEQHAIALAQFIYDWKVTAAENYHSQTESRCSGGDNVPVPVIGKSFAMAGLLAPAIHYK